MESGAGEGNRTLVSFPPQKMAYFVGLRLDKCHFVGFSHSYFYSYLRGRG